MPIIYDKNIAFLEKICEVEEAEEFIKWLKKTKDPVIDLTKTEHIHTAILQIILIFKPEIKALPGNSLKDDLKFLINRGVF